MHVDILLITPSSFHGTMLWLQAHVRKPLRSLLTGTLSHVGLPCQPEGTRDITR